MPIWGKVSSQHELRFRDADDRDFVVLSGIAEFDFPGQTGGWRHEELLIKVGPKWDCRPDEVVPVLALASISKQNPVVVAGWGIDSFSWHTMDNTILLKGQLAVDGLGAHLYRVSFYVTAVGELAEEHESNDDVPAESEKSTQAAREKSKPSRKP